MSPGLDQFNLQRFVDAQAPVYPQVVTELNEGRKQSHWMWYIFPQIEGLGRSAMAERYAIGSLDEGRAYLAHPLLEERLRQCTELALEHSDQHINHIFPYPDHLKFHSCMTLFARVSGGDNCYCRALSMFFAGKEDDKTALLLGLKPE